ncbi:MAG: hypothetical protein ACUVWP_06050 [bacterium]
MVAKKKIDNKKVDKGSNSDMPKGRLWLYLISFLFPLIGFVFALGYAHGIEDEERIFGRRCFILGISGVFIYVIFIISWALYIFIKS